MSSILHWKQTPARVLPGHQVASGGNGNPLFPGGTVRMQAPHFLARGLDLAPYHPGTLNVTIAPQSYRVVAPRVTLRGVKWHPTEPAEDFSFFDVRVLRDGQPDVAGLIYYPHPDTKPAHFQQTEVLELLLPFTPGVAYGTAIRLEIPEEQLRIEPPPTPHWRPRFHFSARQGDLGDPNGLFFRDNRWHLHYQTGWPRSWGHASSSDLLHWEEHPLSLPSAPRDACWSGGVVDDARNTSGLFAPGAGGLVALYTAHDPDMQGKSGEQSIALATSTDGGRTWTRYAQNPVLVGTTSNCRDPKVFWHAPTIHWVMLITEGCHLAFFASDNLRNWTPLSTFQPPRPTKIDAFECPDLFSLPVDGQPGVSKWVLTTSYVNGVNFTPGGFGLCEQQYFIGEFNGITFYPEAGLNPPRRLGAGPDEYAALVWPRQTNPARTVLIGWMGRWGYAGQGPTYPWKEHMTLPREITLHATGREGWELRMAPARELWSLPHQLFDGHLKSVAVGDGRQTLGKSRCAVLQVVLKPSKHSVIQFEFFASGALGTLVGYDSVRQVLYFDRRTSGSPEFHPSFQARYETSLALNDDGRLSMVIVIDQITVEVFAQEGATYLSGNVYPDPTTDEITLQAVSGACEIESLELRDLAAWASHH